jgi:hypothetical protein
MPGKPSIVVADEAQPRARFDERPADVRAGREHHADQVGGLEEGEIADTGRGDDRKASGARVLGMEGIDLERGRWWDHLPFGVRLRTVGGGVVLWAEDERLHRQRRRRPLLAATLLADNCIDLAGGGDEHRVAARGDLTGWGAAADVIKGQNRRGLGGAVEDLEPEGGGRRIGRRRRGHRCKRHDQRKQRNDPGKPPPGGAPRGEHAEVQRHA